MTETLTVYAHGTLHLPGQAHGHPPGTELVLPKEHAERLIADGLVSSDRGSGSSDQEKRPE